MLTEFLTPPITMTTNWAEEAFSALDGTDQMDLSKWTYSAAEDDQGLPPSAFAAPPLFSEASIERYGQMTPADDLSPAVSPTNGLVTSSEKTMQTRNKWATDPQFRQLAKYQPISPPDEPTPPVAQSSRSRRTLKRSAPTIASNPDKFIAVPEQPTASQSQDPPQPKRKRGRPKSQPESSPSVENFPFPVSSARESHLEKNRVAAHKCRQRRKEYINGLETKARECEDQNKYLKGRVAGLREELLQLKNIVLQHANCGCWAIDEYLTQSASGLLGIEAPMLSSRRQSQAHTGPTGLGSLTSSSSDRNTQQPSPIQNSPESQSQNFVDYGEFDLVNDLDDDNMSDS